MRPPSARLVPQRLPARTILAPDPRYVVLPDNRAWSHQRPAPPRGLPASGSISTVASGQGHGYIRADDGRRIYFHRNDSKYGTFNALVGGDPVTFDLHEDPVSGPRALNVRRLGP